MELLGILFLVGVAAVVYKMMTKKETFEQAVAETTKETVAVATPVVEKVVEEVKAAAPVVEAKIEEVATEVVAKVKKARKKKAE